MWGLPGASGSRHPRLHRHSPKRSKKADHCARQPPRSSVPAVHKDMRWRPESLLLLGRGRLVVAESEFNRWRDAEKRKRKWPSQRSRSYARAQLRRTGRPTKQTDDLRQAVLGLLREGVWSAGQPIPELQRRLIALGRDDVPSTDTLARLIDNLHDEIGSSGLRRAKRARRQRSKRSSMTR